MPSDQIKRHFEVHQTWCRSLKSTVMSPVISHLDQQRVEYYEDGTIIKRSAREWATSLKLDDGTPVHSDTVNGGSERQTIFLCPQNYHDQALIEWRNYRSRLNPPSHREARYIGSITGLPDLSNIRIEIETNVSLLDQLSAADIWKNAPDSIRKEPSNQQGKQKRKSKVKEKRNQSTPTHKTIDQDSVISASDASMDDSAANTCGNTTTDASATRSIASTAATSTAPKNASNSRFRELERRIQSAQKQSNAEGQASAAKLSGLQTQFFAMEDKMSTERVNRII